MLHQLLRTYYVVDSVALRFRKAVCMGGNVILMVDDVAKRNHHYRTF